MSKRQGPTLFIGSLQVNYWNYISKTIFNLNPKDPYAFNHFRQVKYQFKGKNKNSKLHPEHKFILKNSFGIDNHSYIEHYWINNTSRKFYMHDNMNWKEIMFQEMKLYNEICDNEMIIKEQDEELEDEIKWLQ